MMAPQLFVWKSCCQISRPSPAAMAAAQDSKTTSTPSMSTLPAHHKNYSQAVNGKTVDAPFATVKHISDSEVMPLTIMNEGLSPEVFASVQPMQSKTSA
jgi:hypothetical protein